MQPLTLKELEDLPIGAKVYRVAALPGDPDITTVPIKHGQMHWYQDRKYFLSADDVKLYDVINKLRGE